MMWSLAPWWHWLTMLLFWVAVVAVAIWAVGLLFPSAPRDDRDARSLLDERLARGELDPDEYRRLRDLLVRSGSEERWPTR